MKFDGFVDGTFALSSVQANIERCVNWLPEPVAGTGKAKIVFRATPGLVLFATLPSSPVRALWSGAVDLYAVAGTGFYRVSSGGAVSLRGTVANDGLPAQIIAQGDGNALLVISGGQAYIDQGGVYGGALPTAPVPADDTVGIAGPATVVGTATSAAYLGTYFIATKKDSKRFWISAPNDGSSWDALDFETAEAWPDNISRVLADHEELWLMGTDTIEIWRQEGDADHVFRKDPTAFIPQGLFAIASAVNLLDGPAWLGGDARGGPIAYTGKGFMPKRISNNAVEQAWTSYGVWADAIGSVVVIDGHSSWHLTFPTGNATWVYDQTTDMWHERAFWNGSTNGRHKANCHTFMFNKHLIGDYSSGNIYQMSSALSSDAGTDIHRVRTAPHLNDEAKDITYSRLQLDIDDPAGNHTGALMEFSDDSGVTWSTARVPDTTSALPRKMRRMVWRRLGASRDRVFRVTFTQQFPISIIGAGLELSGGIS